MRLKFVWSFLLIGFLSMCPSSNATNVFCYYESLYEDSFGPEDIDIDICTHVIYTFLGINENGTLRLDGSEELLYKLSDLKSKNADLKLIFSVGGWAAGSPSFSNVAADDAKKVTMANNALWYLQNYNFDGIDIDWEYPGGIGVINPDRENFIDMLSVLRNKFDENGGYLLTTAVCSDPDCGEYDVGGISKVVDYILLMTYDMNTALDYKTGQNSPLYASSNDSEWEEAHDNCDAAINNWLNKGASPTKLILGLGFYGHGFTLFDPNNHGIGADVIGEGQGGSYDTICALTDGWTEVWDDEQENPYKYKGNQWIGFDNPRSIGLKVRYAIDRYLGGVMVWSVNEDDNDGSCGTKHALLQAIKDNL